MKLILANNQSEKFVDFYKDLNTKSSEPLVYDSYQSLLFCFDTDNSDTPLDVVLTSTGQSLREFDGVYINGYLNTYELAVTTATSLDYLGVAYVNRELQNAPSLSKLSSYAKLTAAGVTMPKTYAGSKQAIVAGLDAVIQLDFPVILKRADADRGIDNFKISSKQQLRDQLRDFDDRSLWVLQAFIPNNGFYLVSIYNNEPKFVIFRSLEERPDHDELKAHMFKPKGGANAHLVELPDAPELLLDTSLAAVKAMNRQIASVDSIYDEQNNKVYILEVNYNPQLVTIETFKDVRVQAFLDTLINFPKA